MTAPRQRDVAYVLGMTVGWLLVASLLMALGLMALGAYALVSYFI